MALVTESEIVVRYAETDRMGVAYHANYLVWMEVGRTDYLARLGFPYSSLEAAGVLFPTCDASFRLYKPSYYEERLRIETRLEKLRSRKVVFGYRVMRSGELVVSGRTEHICVNAKLRVQKIPVPLFEALGRALDNRK